MLRQQRAFKEAARRVLGGAFERSSSCSFSSSSSHFGRVLFAAKEFTSSSSSSLASTSSTKASVCCSKRRGRSFSSRFSSSRRREYSNNLPTKEKEQNHVVKFQEKWEELMNQHPSVALNPCNSELHPAVVVGAAKVDETKPKRSLQEAYDPFASCFVCSKNGQLKLETRRTSDRKILRSELARGLPETYEELPGIIAPGMITSVMACSGSWHGSIALMDKAVLARPPLMMLEKIIDFTATDVLAPNEKCSVHSEIVSLDEPNFATVKMEMTIGGHEKDDEESNSTSGNKSRSNYTSKKTVCARAIMRFKKIGAVRSIS
ncbi:predicted protein [Bathycoccus prasinos]|uniref:Uncharacterized protein n=1 Tax=Bathycoccus prasinos TaxID=41875 RepID=K8EDG5_9CHLO|nr:predicted protein [Bathycoccus prasinos]CCO16046.1 predicted protein [Bathycoccus prasinos]|eukprot:XP_007513521.1 predicted protein [Bathycoccus prasinos]